MALADLIAALEREARSRAEQAIAVAKEEALRIDRAADAESKRVLEAALAEAHARERTLTERALAAARKEAARRLIEERRSAVARVLARATEIFSSEQMRRRFEELLPELERQARDALGTDELLIDSAAGRLGIRAQDASRRTTVDLTVEARVAQLEPELAIAIAARIAAMGGPT